jgi:hypothetical protein
VRVLAEEAERGAVRVVLDRARGVALPRRLPARSAKEGQRHGPDQHGEDERTRGGQDAIGG